jgi:broad specificity phosphatase PhoE
LEVAQQHKESNTERTLEKSPRTRAYQTAKNVAQTLHEKPSPCPQKEHVSLGQELTQDERELLKQWKEYDNWELER